MSKVGDLAGVTPPIPRYTPHLGTVVICVVRLYILQLTTEEDKQATMEYVELPKIKLHAHLTGSISRQALHEIWLRKKETGNTDLDDPLVVMPEVLTDFLNDGVCYLELRTTPRSTPQLSAEQYIATLVDTISLFEYENPQLHTRVVDLDLCGDPTARPNGEISIFTPVFEEANTKGLGITVHFAEAEASGSEEELSTLLSWKPGRLGHVIWEGEDTKKEIARRGLCLELCLSCNVKADMVIGGFEGHHFGHWREVEGPKISLSTDDVGVFGSPLSNEYRLVAQHFGLDRQAIYDLASQPIDGIFGGDQEKERLRRLMCPR
ncbi:unnamed protein product [Fusarium graminearum]|nr:unnamed protein product [Fusarium graminearum]